MNQRNQFIHRTKMMIIIIICDDCKIKGKQTADDYHLLNKCTDMNVVCVFVINETRLQQNIIKRNFILCLLAL